MQTLFLSTFFGGSDTTWDSPQDQYIRFDDMSVKAGLCPPETVVEQSFGTPSRVQGTAIFHLLNTAPVLFYCHQ